VSRAFRRQRHGRSSVGVTASRAPCAPTTASSAPGSCVMTRCIFDISLEMGNLMAGFFSRNRSAKSHCNCDSRCWGVPAKFGASDGSLFTHALVCYGPPSFSSSCLILRAVIPIRPVPFRARSLNLTGASACDFCPWTIADYMAAESGGLSIEIGALLEPHRMLFQPDADLPRSSFSPSRSRPPEACRLRILTSLLFPCKCPLVQKEVAFT